MSERVRPHSLITLHYRIATTEGVEFLSTFDAAPATLQLGAGELAPTLEACLIDLPVGERFVFLLEPEQAFGVRNPALTQRIARRELPAEASLHAFVEFAAPNGEKYMGLIRALDAECALVDFNHPLAGCAIRFEVEVIGVLS
ncbi:MAG: FKBP-type peptidyl-prolyl cis-trans isomerase [Rhodocyclaceae bacterium]|nr:FKBP-type peptidyl-prolyl cis-trans isomerase [Rhodocyclaceae bacterium]